MNLDNLMLKPVLTPEPQLKLGGGLRLPAGPLPELHVGEQVSIKVLEQKGTNTFIELKGARLLVPTQPGLVPGTQLQARVTGQGSPPILELLSGAAGKPSLVPKEGFSSQAVLEVLPGERPSSAPLPPLTLGQQVAARVLGQLPSGRYLIDIYQVPLQARGPDGLAPGSTLSVAVAQLQPHVVLRILEPEPSLETAALRLLQAQSSAGVKVAVSLPELAQAVAALGDSVSAQGVFGRLPRLELLGTLLKTLLPPQVPPDAETIATLVRDGGLHLESKLARMAQAVTQSPEAMADIANRDLKGLLLQVLGDLDRTAPQEQLQAQRLGNESSLWPSQPQATAPDDSPGSFRGLVQGHLHQIENQQLANVLARFHSEPYQLHIPLFLPQGATTAFLAIEPDEQNRQGPDGTPQQGHSLLFSLQLEQLGEIRIDAYAVDQRLRVIFYGEKPEVLQAIDGELPAFRETLVGLGFTEVLLGVRGLQQLSPDREVKFAALAAGRPAAVHCLDVQA